ALTEDGPPAGSSRRENAPGFVAPALSLRRAPDAGPTDPGRSTFIVFQTSRCAGRVSTVGVLYQRCVRRGARADKPGRTRQVLPGRRGQSCPERAASPAAALKIPL